MPVTVGDSYSWGGVDSRSNALNVPRSRSLRCLNWEPDVSNTLRLRYGFTNPGMSTTSATPITSAAYWELWNGAQYVLFQQTNHAYSYAVGSGAVTQIDNPGDPNAAPSTPWGVYRANNRFFFSGKTINHQPVTRMWDGTTSRPVGLPALFTQYVNQINAGFTTDSQGEFTATQLTGYNFYISIYNPTTGHVGNRMQIAGPMATALTGSGAVKTITIASAGTGYATNDVLTISGGDGTAQLTATAVDGTGAILTYNITAGGTTYTAPTNGVSATGGTGTGFTLNITAVYGLSITFNNLPNLLFDYGYSEWVKLIGRTPDGGQVPYACTDDDGNWITISNEATTFTLQWANVDFNSELPTANDPPPGEFNEGAPPFIGFTKVLDRAYAINGVDPYLYYTESEADAVSGSFVGNWEESWTGDNAEPFPPAEVLTAVHGTEFEVWCFSKNNMAIFSYFMLQQISNPWRGPWAGAGCPSQRGFVLTPYGPFWVNNVKQLMTFNGTMPTAVDGEYHQAIMAKIGDAYLSSIELSYVRDADKNIDHIEILAKDSNGNPLYIIHDFLATDSRSPQGQAYTRAYTGMTPTTLVSSGYSPWTPVYDTNKKPRLWCGDSLGHLYQLNDGYDDNGQEFTGDYIGAVNVGDSDPRIIEEGWYGDTQTMMQFSTRLDQQLTDWKTPATEVLPEERSGFRCAAKVSDQGMILYHRFLLTSHSNGGQLTYELAEPIHIPLETYGRIYLSRLKIGADRPERR